MQVDVFTTNSTGPGQSDRMSDTLMRRSFNNNLTVFYFRKYKSFIFSFALLYALFRDLKNYDVIHLTGVYSFTTLPVLLLSSIFKRPLIWSPRGALQDWQGGKKQRLKIVWNKLCGQLLTKKLVTMHVTSEQEKSESLKKISVGSCVVIVNGVDVPERSAVESKAVSKSNKHVLYLGRLDEKKGIEYLLRAVSILKNNGNSNIILDVCGDGDPVYTKKIKELASLLGVTEITNFHGHVTGELKHKILLNSDVAVFPSYTENFGVVVAESLAYSIPVVVTKNMPWDEVENRNCGLIVSRDATSIADSIKKILSSEEIDIGVSGRDWMEKDFGWESIAKQMLDTYERATHVI